MLNPGALKDLILRHRNILIIQLNPQTAEPSSVAQYDVYARPQIIVTLTAPDTNGMVRYLSENRQELQQLFEISERNRAVENNRKYGEKGIDREIRSLFGIDMNIPRGFSIKGRSGEDFLWVGNDVRTATQGLVLYSYPYAGAEDFAPENLIKRRNEFTGRIPGPSEGSFMATEDYIRPEVEYIRIDGKLWARMSGFWYVENDYMGGTVHQLFDHRPGDRPRLLGRLLRLLPERPETQHDAPARTHRLYGAVPQTPAAE